MALLCTLHADGPRTLRTLREAGCTTIAQLGQLSPDRVGKLLGLPSAAARRLTREAQRLRERLDPDLEPEEVTYPPAAEVVAKPAPARRYQLLDEPVASAPAPAPEPAPVAPEPARAGLDLRDRELLERVVERWRNEDTVAPLPDFGVGAEELAGLAQVEVRAGRVAEVDDAIEEVETVEEAAPEPPVAAAAAPSGLRPGDLVGLDAHACAALAAAGVRSLEDLATHPIDELRERSGLAYTRARTLQFLAGRELADAAPRAAEPEERLSPAERPVELPEPELHAVVEDVGGWDLRRLPDHLGDEFPDDGGAAGPFA